MNLHEATSRPEELINQLLTVWEESVRATHSFLTEEDIRQIATDVPAALGGIPHLIIARNEASAPVAFMGIEGRKLEMLFVSPEERGKGTGTQLLQYSVEQYAVNEVCVNEQNPQALGFYEHMGFRIYKRTEHDEQGNPFPLLYMRLKK